MPIPPAADDEIFFEVDKTILQQAELTRSLLEIALWRRNKLLPGNHYNLTTYT